MLYLGNELNKFQFETIEGIENGLNKFQFEIVKGIKNGLNKFQVEIVESIKKKSQTNSNLKLSKALKMG